MFLILNFLVGLAYAFIPPVAVLAKEAVEGRRSQPYSEVVLRHHIATSSGEAVDIEEQWVGDSQRAAVVFKIPSGNVITAASLDKKNYVFPAGLRLVSASGLVEKYLLTSSGDDLLGTLLNERFIRREHLSQFKEGFEPKGDPQTWDVKEHYNHQEGVSLRRVKQQPAFAFSGTGSEGSSQTVFFYKEGSGVRRFEWKRGTDTVGWNFAGHTRFQSAGTFPKQLEFEKNGQTLVTTELLVHRSAKEKQFAELKKYIRTVPPPSGSYEEALKILLSFR